MRLTNPLPKPMGLSAQPLPAAPAAGATRACSRIVSITSSTEYRSSRSRRRAALSTSSVLWNTRSAASSSSDMGADGTGAAPAAATVPGPPKRRLCSSSSSDPPSGRGRLCVLRAWSAGSAAARPKSASNMRLAALKEASVRLRMDSPAAELAQATNSRNDTRPSRSVSASTTHCCAVVSASCSTVRPRRLSVLGATCATTRKTPRRKVRSSW
mmetsp:Transcript_24680/g.79428  ORF Transcript_24680/g.79428 Transcript_24680/m.79428 type:complete len:213 (-) Transcript_24680:913-1551(-)